MSTGTQVEVVMPQMGVSVAEGTITRWLKQPGDNIALDEPLLEISTDKVDTEVPSPGEGILVEVRVQEGETVEVGTVLAVIGPAGAATVEPESPPETPTPEAAPAAPSEPEPLVASEPVAQAPSTAARARHAALAGADAACRRGAGPADASGVERCAGELRQREDLHLARRRADRRGARSRPGRDPWDGPGRSRDEEGHPRLHRVRGGRVSRATPRGARRGARARNPRCRASTRPGAPACPRRGVSAGRAGATGSAGRPASCAGAAAHARDGRGRRARGADERDATRHRRAHASLTGHVRTRDQRDRGRHVPRRLRRARG